MQIYGRKPDKIEIKMKIILGFIFEIDELMVGTLSFCCLFWILITFCSGLLSFCRLGPLVMKSEEKEDVNRIRDSEECQSWKKWQFHRGNCQRTN
jgi:hypothetical protein